MCARNSLLGLMQSTGREILGGCDVLGSEARAHMGRGAAPRWVIRKVVPAKSHNRPRMARDGGEWLSNRLRELWLMEALPTRRLGNGHPDVWETQDVHWKALTVLDKLHKSDRKEREKAIAEFAREASEGAAGLLHRLNEATCSLVPKRCGARGRRPTRVMRRNWRPRAGHASGGCTSRPWEIPSDEDMSFSAPAGG